MKAGRPPRWRYSWRMSGVFGQRFGLKNSATSVCVNSVKYSVSSLLVLRHVKYVYDWLNPNRASRYMILGRVKASDKKIRSGCFFLRSRIIHSQKSKGFVWGLSTRKIRTPCSIQNSTMLFNSSQSDRQCGDSNSKGYMSSYFFGGFSAY